MKFVKKMVKRGNSLTLTIPSDVVEAMDLEEGKFVKVDIEKEGE